MDTVKRKKTDYKIISSWLNKMREGGTISFPVLWLLFIALIITLVLKLWTACLVLLLLTVIMTVVACLAVKRKVNHLGEEIKSMHDLIERKEGYISDFSHRIRTPLNNLPVINDLLCELDVTAKQKELLDTLISSTNNMISALNELTMKSAGVLSIEPRKNIRFELRKTIDNTIELMDMDQNGNLTPDISWDDMIKKEYQGDPVAVKQIFIDILTMCSTVSDTELPDINISVRPKARDEIMDVIEFRIEADLSYNESDIAPHKDMFEKSLSVKIINLMEGDYAYETRGDRSVFIFSIPFYNVTEESTVTALGEKIRKLDTVISREKSLSDANVLLVEDNITNQKIVTISLGSKVKNIDTAADGKQALDMFGKSNYDVILMDIRIPIMDGITVSKKIRDIEASTSKHTPIIAITANAMIGDKEKCLSAGMDDYLSKPFQPQKLLELISKHLKGLTGNH